MYQSFEVRGDSAAAARNLPMLRMAMQKLNIDALLVPHDDEYLNEYTPHQFERLRWVTGFTGSAGTLLLMQESAVLFIDGRYTEQARIETAAELFEYEDLRATPPAMWLKANPGQVKRLAYANKLHCRAEIAAIEATEFIEPIELVALDVHPVDEIWSDRPRPNLSAPYPHANAYCGESSAGKRRRIGKSLQDRGIEYVVFTNPNASAWLLNIRGSDVPNTPVVLCRTVLHANGSARVFFNDHEITAELIEHLGENVRIANESDFRGYLESLGDSDTSVLLDTAVCSQFVYQILRDSGAVIREGSDPLIPLRSVKNAVEIEGARRAHVRDGVAMVKFLRWLQNNWDSGLSEIDAVTRLEQFRAEDAAMQGISFDTISGSGPNGAIIHYRVSEASNRKLEAGDLFLVDSGAQYLDGTTDVTRTMALGQQDAERKDRYTRVLQGHIALASAVFPPDTSGYQLDMLARQPLWNIGLDYAHGTGHGVGTYLGVHEGPQSIAKRAATVPLQPGMTITIEPGYYVEGEYGIRIENVAMVRESPVLSGMFEFEPMTMAPIDTSMIDIELMSDSDIRWLDDYHALVRESLTNHLDDEHAIWLEQATEPFTAAIG